MSNSEVSSGLASESTSTNNTLFPFETRLGLVFVVEASFLSTIAVSYLLLRILYTAFAWRLGFKSNRRWSMDSHLHYYFLSMLVADLIQAIAGTFNIRWISDAAVIDGSLCTAQGILKQIGDVGVAFSSLAITIHTFSVLVLHWKPRDSCRPAMFVVASIWIFLALSIGVNAAKNGRKGYWGDTQYWCWITEEFPVQRIVLEYLWLWTTALIDLILYIPLYLVIRGMVVVNGYQVRWIKSSERRQISPSSNSHSRSPDDIALEMLFYPAVYIITVLPVGIVRWRAFRSQSVPYSATFFADFLFCCSGLFNVVLFSITRPALMPHRRPDSNIYPAMMFSSNSQHTYELSSRNNTAQMNISVRTWGDSSPIDIDKKDDIALEV